MSTLNKEILGCSIDSNIDLNECWSRDDVSTGRIIRLLIENDPHFEQIRSGSEIKEVTFPFNNLHTFNIKY